MLFSVLTLQEYIRRVIKPANKDELVQGIQQFWATVDVQKCRRYIGHLRRVLPHIVELNGDAYWFLEVECPLENRASFPYCHVFKLLFFYLLVYVAMTLML